LTPVYVGIGSNLGDRLAQCARAICELNRCPQMKVSARSSFYLTSPVGPAAENWFVNCVVEIYTSLPARELLRVLQTIEIDLGRKRGIAGGPRLIDLDLLLYGDQVIDEEDLVVPHPALPHRRFVLAPLAEIAPRLLHPQLRVTIEELNDSLLAKDVVMPLRVGAGLALPQNDPFGMQDFYG
jgi:2-amino-4-hydroxy-6-hydroxymethyldihydropteridine diphosphokinase